MKNFLINTVCFVLWVLTAFMKLVNFALSLVLVFMVFSRLNKRG